MERIQGNKESASGVTSLGGTGPRASAHIVNRVQGQRCDRKQRRENVGSRARDTLSTALRLPFPPFCMY